MADIEFRWYKPARGLSYVLQIRKPEGPIGEQWDGPWKDVPHVREGREEEDMEEYEKLWT